MALLDLHKLPLASEGPIKLLNFLLRHDVIVVTGDEQDADCTGDTLEVGHIVLSEEGEGQTGLYLLFEEVQKERD